MAVGIFRGKGALTKAGVACARGLLNLGYHAFDLLPRRDEVLFFSRQANEPSADFVALGRAFAARGFRPVYLTRKLSVRSALPYVGFAARELYHLARCRVCVIDRYDPVVSLVNMKGSPYPTEPLVLQVWHAFGAFKKFGYQMLGTREAHSPEVARIFCIHRNNSYVVCSSEAARAAYAEAFNLPVERVVALPRPEYFRLKELAAAGGSGHGGACGSGGRECGAGAGGQVAREAAAGGLTGDCAEESSTQPSESSEPSPRAHDAGGCANGAGANGGGASAPSVLFAPTLRKDAETAHPMRDLHASQAWRQLEGEFGVEWSFHPLEAEGVAAGDINEALLRADYVVTDYSSIVYEAYLLGKRVLFYVPDADEYAATPGLNDNPVQLCPDLCFSSPEDLMAALHDFACGARPYPAADFERFAARGFQGLSDDPDAIVNFALSQLGR